MNFIFSALIGQRLVRNLCSFKEALTGGLDETALARERKLEATSDLAHGDERNRESLLLPNLRLGLTPEELDRRRPRFCCGGCESASALAFPSNLN